MPKDNEVDEKVNGAFSTNRDEISSKLTSLIDRYWELAYAEGQEGRTHDTDNGDAQECRYEIEKAIKSLSDHAATVAELRAKADAAERRVGELEAALSDLISVADPLALAPREYKRIREQTARGTRISIDPFPLLKCRYEDVVDLTDGLKRTRATLTGADPT